MSKRKCTLVSYKNAVQDILNFVEDGDIENILPPIIEDHVECERDKHEQSSDEENDDPVIQGRISCCQETGYFIQAVDWI